MKHRDAIRTCVAVVMTIIAVAVLRANLAGAQPAPAARPWQPTTATWYGPDYYYHHFACPHAGIYHHATRGVAVNASFANCGDRFEVRHAGHTIRVRVIDICPGCDGGGHAFDLTARSDMDLQGCRSYCRPFTMQTRYRRIVR